MWAIVRKELIMDPKEFTMRMQAIANKENTLYYNQADRHRDMDNLMCEVLQYLGYGDGVEIFKAPPRWYS